MNIKSLTIMSLVVIATLLSACQDKQAQAQAEKKETLKSVLQQSNNKLLSDEEIKARLRENGNGSDSAK